MPEDILPVPLEIPWRLAATTQQLQPGFPEDTTLSLFIYEPQTASLSTDYPDERLIYLKFTASISPCHVDSASLPEWARSLLVGGSPVLHVVLDVGVTPEPFATGGIRPYFHAAAPIRRSMIETGIVGDVLYEGESESLAVGKSASQLHETISSQVTTKSKGWSLGLPGVVRGGKRTTDTTVNSDRSVEQYLENVNREASEERRELLSHMTHVQNVLTLLTAKHVGSPFLRFTLSPRPLTPLSVDPGDQNLWYRQLLERRSAGIEGIQEFIAVVAVPRNTDFCIQALLRRICVIDDPPVPPQIPRGAASEAELLQMWDYLYRKYPRGTPLDEFDVDVLSNEQLKDTDSAPSLLLWASPDFIAQTGPGGLMYGLGQFGNWFPSEDQPGVSWNRFIYKTADEVRRDMLLDLYLEDLARSPLERGTVHMRSLSLSTCFRLPDEGLLRVRQATADVQLPSEVPFAAELDFRAARNLNGDGGSSDVHSAVVRWNLLERQLHDHVARQPSNKQTLVSYRTTKMLHQLLRRLSKLAEDDPRNLSLERAASALRLTVTQVALLKRGKVRDLKGLAQMLLIAPSAERQYAGMREFLAGLTAKQRCQFNQEPAKPTLSARAAQELLDTMAATLPSPGAYTATHNRKARTRRAKRSATKRA